MLANPGKEPQILRISSSTILSLLPWMYPQVEVPKSMNSKEKSSLNSSSSLPPLYFGFLYIRMFSVWDFGNTETISLKWKARSVGLSGSPDWGKEEQRLKKDTHTNLLFFFFFLIGVWLHVAILVSSFLLTNPLSSTSLTCLGCGLSYFCLHLNFSGDTVSLSLSRGSYLIQFTMVWWWLQRPRGLGLEISVKVHLMEWSKQHFSFTLFPELLLLRNCHAI